MTKLLGRIQGERSETAKAVVRKHLSPTLTADLTRLDEQTASVKDLAVGLLRRARKSPKRVPIYLRAIEKVWSKSNAQLRKAAARAREALDHERLAALRALSPLGTGGWSRAARLAV